MQHGFIATGIDFECGADSVRAAHEGSAVKIPVRVHEQTGLGRSPVIAVAEAVQHRLISRGIELIYDSIPVRSAGGRDAVEIAVGVLDQGAPWILTVGSARKIM